MLRTHGRRGTGGLAGAGLACLLLVACGGGGGGTGDGGAAPPPVSDTGGLVTVTVANVGEAAGAAMHIVELALMAGQALVDETLALGAERAASRAVDCGVAIGSATARLVDADGSGGPSAGDRIEIEYDGCRSPRLDYAVHGRLSLQLTSVQAGGRGGLSGVVDFDGTSGGLVFASSQLPGAALFRLQGLMHLDCARSAFSTRLRATAAVGRDIRVVAADDSSGSGYRLSAFDLDKATSYEQARISLGVAGRFEDDAIGGAVLLSTPRALSSYIGHYPEARADQGRIEIAGLGAARGRILPSVRTAGGTSGSFEVRVEFDRLGVGAVDASGTSGWSNLVAGYLWSDELQPLPYRIEVVEAGNGPSLINAFAGADAWPRDEVLRVQLSQPPAPAARLVGRLLDLGLRAPQGYGGTGEPSEVAVEQQWSGASLRVRPLEPLRPSHRYQLELSNDGDWSSVRQVWLPRVGQSPLGVPTSIAFATADTLRPVIGTPDGALVVRDAAVHLTAADSRTGPGTRYRWSQVGGPALAFDHPDAADTVVRLVDRSGAVGTASVRLTVTDALGDSESIERDVRTVGDARGTWLLRFSSPPGEFVGRGVTDYLGDALGSFTVLPPTSPGVIGVMFQSLAFPDPPAVWWDLGLSTGSLATPLAPGRYTMTFGSEGPKVDFSGNGRTCGTGAASGSFEIFEIERDAAGTLTRLAADFTQTCSGSSLALTGAVRFNSTWPLLD